MENPLADTVILITRDGMGSADGTLQHKLLDTWLRLLVENETLPHAICFYTDGVRLVVDGSPLLERLISNRTPGCAFDYLLHLPRLFQADGQGTGGHRRRHGGYPRGAVQGN